MPTFLRMLLIILKKVVIIKLISSKRESRFFIKCYLLLCFIICILNSIETKKASAKAMNTIILRIRKNGSMLISVIKDFEIERNARERFNLFQVPQG